MFYSKILTDYKDRITAKKINKEGWKEKKKIQQIIKGKFKGTNK